MSDPRILYCVGATKAGTSWLYRTLADHPDCAPGAIKEAHYWDTFDAEARERQLAAFRARRAGFAARREEARAAGRGWQVANLDRQIADLDGLVAVIAGPRDGDAAYAGWLTAGAEGRLSTDMTPAYAMLESASFARMAALSARGLFVYLVRDPLARLWSHVRMQAERQRRAGETFEEKANSILWRILNKGQETHIPARGDYPGTVARLREAVAPGRLRVESVERLVTPGAWAGFCRWLGIAERPADGAARVHEGPAAQMRPDLRGPALRFLREHYDWAARELGPLPDAWQRNYAEAHS